MLLVLLAVDSIMVLKPGVVSASGTQRLCYVAIVRRSELMWTVSACADPVANKNCPTAGCNCSASQGKMSHDGAGNESIQNLNDKCGLYVSAPSRQGAQGRFKRPLLSDTHYWDPAEYWVLV